MANPALTIKDGSAPCICSLPDSQFPQNLKVITHGETVSHPHFGSEKKKKNPTKLHPKTENPVRS